MAGWIFSLLAPSLRPKSLAANLQSFKRHYTRNFRSFELFLGNEPRFAGGVYGQAVPKGSAEIFFNTFLISNLRNTTHSNCRIKVESLISHPPGVIERRIVPGSALSSIALAAVDGILPASTELRRRTTLISGRGKCQGLRSASPLPEMVWEEGYPSPAFPPFILEPRLEKPRRGAI